MRHSGIHPSHHLRRKQQGNSEEHRAKPPTSRLSHGRKCWLANGHGEAKPDGQIRAHNG